MIQKNFFFCTSNNRSNTSRKGKKDTEYLTTPTEFYAEDLKTIKDIENKEQEKLILGNGRVLTKIWKLKIGQPIMNSLTKT